MESPKLSIGIIFRDGCCRGDVNILGSGYPLKIAPEEILS